MKKIIQKVTYALSILKRDTSLLRHPLWLTCYLVSLVAGYAQVPPPTVTGGNSGQNPHNRVKPWRFGGNVSVLLGDPLLIDASPSVTYNPQRKIRLGLGVNYRYSLFKKTDSITQVYGGRVFGQYQPLNWFFVSGELEGLNVPNTITGQTEIAQNRIWQFSPLLGAGIRLRLLRLLEVNIALMRDFNYRKGISPYPSPWRFRFGFSL
ncbi:hypothetical protein BKI52_43255 [marine bacterium AO1-C]|nr:hypothetical protein BKI52_43255 [marine bacterium AO1-C]